MTKAVDWLLFPQSKSVVRSELPSTFLRTDSLANIYIKATDREEGNTKESVLARVIPFNFHLWFFLAVRTAKRQNVLQFRVLTPYSSSS